MLFTPLYKIEDSFAKFSENHVEIIEHLGILPCYFIILPRNDEASLPFTDNSEWNKEIPHHSFVITRENFIERTQNMDSIPPAKEAQLPIWSATFATNLATYKTQLGITDPDIANINALLATFNTALGNLNNAKKAQTSATQSKKAAQKALVTAERALIRRVPASPGATTAIRVALGINKRTGQRTKTPPTIPTEVVATTSADGVNTIKWNRNANKPATTFRIDMMKTGDTEWTFVDNTTKTKFDHTGQTPGVTIYYRVTATRSDMVSEPSQTASVYGPPRFAPTPLKIAA